MRCIPPMGIAIRGLSPRAEVAVPRPTRFVIASAPRYGGKRIAGETVYTSTPIAAIAMT